jgi:hypothetical protein
MGEQIYLLSYISKTQFFFFHFEAAVEMHAAELARDKETGDVERKRNRQEERR